MPEPNTYKLLYKNYEIGTVTELNDEWPRPSGTIELNESLKNLNGETKSLFDYIDFSIKASEILDNGDHEAYEKYCTDNESRFMELIDGNDWFLVDRAGKKNNIVIPILSPNNEIVWTAFEG